MNANPHQLVSSLVKSVPTLGFFQTENGEMGEFGNPEHRIRASCLVPRRPSRHVATLSADPMRGTGDVGMVADAQLDVADHHTHNGRQPSGRGWISRAAAWLGLGQSAIMTEHDPPTFGKEWNQCGYLRTALANGREYAYRERSKQDHLGSTHTSKRIRALIDHPRRCQDVVRDAGASKWGLAARSGQVRL